MSWGEERLTILVLEEIKRCHLKCLDNKTYQKQN